MLYHVQKKSKRNLLSTETARRTTSSGPESLRERPRPIKGGQADVQPRRDGTSADDGQAQLTSVKVGFAGQEALEAVDDQKTARCRLPRKLDSDGSPRPPVSFQWLISETTYSAISFYDVCPLLH